MLSPSRGFWPMLLLGGQHARHSVSPTRPRTTRPYHGAVAQAAASGRLLVPLLGAGAPVLPGPGSRPSASAGGRRRRAAGLPVPGDLAPGPVRHPARLRRPAPPTAGAAAGLPAPRVGPPPG